MQSRVLSEEVNTRYGRMFMFKEDEVISRSLKVYGEWAEHEISILDSFIRAESTVIDVGANIGTHTLAFANLNKSVDIISIEAQPLVFSVLQINCIINELNNVYCRNMVAGKRNSTLKVSEDNIDWQNVGASSFKEPKNFLKSTPSQRKTNISNWMIPMNRLDYFWVEKPVSLVKIDVEGMELDVIEGGFSLLKHYRPVVFAEQLNLKHLKNIKNLFEKINYNLFWLETHPFNSNNYRREQDNIWWRTEMGILGVPKEGSAYIELPAVTGIEDSLPYQLDARKGTAV